MIKNNRALLLIFLLAIFLLFFRLGSTSLVNWDEAWLASVSQDIATRNDWLNGQWNGQTWFYEPPLVTWTLAILYKNFGPSEFWLRSFNAFLGLFIVIVVYKLSALITKSAKSAFISVIILLSDIEFLFRSRQINVEIPVTFFLIFTLYAALKTLSSPQRRWWIITGMSLGFAFLTKRASPILILPAIIVAVIPARFAEVSARRAKAASDAAKAGIYMNSSAKGGMTKKNFLTMLALFAVAAPWYIISYWRWGDQFINEFFLGYTLGKIRSINPGTGANIFFYVTALRHAFKFFFLLIPFAIVWATIKSFRDRKIVVLMVFILTFLIFLTLAPIKSSWFLLPIHPAIAVIMGLCINNIYKKYNHHILKKFPSCTFLYFFVLFCTFSISAFQLIRYRRDFIVPNTTGHQATLAKLAGQLTPPQNPIYLDDDYLPVAVFYSRRQVIPLRFDRLQPITPLAISSGSYILTNKETFPTLQNTYPNISSVKESADLMLVRNHQP